MEERIGRKERGLFGVANAKSRVFNVEFRILGAREGGRKKESEKLPKKKRLGYISKAC